VTTGAISRAKLQSNHYHQQTNIQLFLQAGRPSCRPTNSVKSLKGKISHYVDLLTPSSPGGLPTLSLTTNSSWLPWGRVAMPHISSLVSIPQCHLSLHIPIIPTNPVSEMTYTVSSGTLNPSIPYHPISTNT